MALRGVVCLLLATVAACSGDDLFLPTRGAPAQRLVAAGGQGQTGQVNSPLPDSLAVRVEDQFGNPVAGVIVEWAAANGGGSGGSVSSTSVPSGVDGRSAVLRVLGPTPGMYSTTATVAGLQGSPVIFTSTATLAPPSFIAILTQPSSVAVTAVPFPQQPVVQLRDAAGNPVLQNGVSVTVAVLGGGALSGTTTKPTDNNGIATFTDLAITGLPGTRTLIFAASGFASVTSNDITVIGATPGSIAVNAGDNQTAPVATAVPIDPSVIVRDQAGAPMPNVLVTFTVQSGNGSVSGGTATANSAGIATVGSWTLGQSAGTNTLQASVQGSGVTGNPVTFTAIGTPGPVSGSATTISVSPDTIQASDKTDLSVITVIARDAFGNPVAGVTVTLKASGSNNDLNQPSGPTNAAGVASGSLSSKEPEVKIVTATVNGMAVSQSQTVTVIPGPPDPSKSKADVPDGVVLLPTVITVELIDEFGNPLTAGSDNVSISVSGANNVGALAVTDRGDGTYQATYRPTFLGNDKVAISVNGASLKGSPFTSKVTLF